MKVVKHGNMYNSFKHWWNKYKLAMIFCPECGVVQEVSKPNFPYSCGCLNCGCRFEFVEEDIAGVK